MGCLQGGLVSSTYIFVSRSISSLFLRPILTRRLFPSVLSPSILLRPYLPPTSLPSPLSLPSNLLLLLQTQTTPIPSTQKLLEKQALLLPAFAKSPFLSSATKEKPAFGETKAVVEGGDWRDYFESDEEEEEEPELAGGGGKKPLAKGGKAAKKAGKGAKGEGRASGMSVHQGVWSLESHRAGFTSAWMGLLSLP